MAKSPDMPKLFEVETAPAEEPVALVAAEPEVHNTEAVERPEDSEYEIGQWWWISNTEEEEDWDDDEDSDEDDEEEEEGDELEYVSPLPAKVNVEVESKERLACITWIGTNYVNVRYPDSEWHSTQRFHFDECPKFLFRREHNPEAYIGSRVEHHQGIVRGLLNEIKLLTSKLGLTPTGELTDGSQSTALVAVHHAPDVQAHKQALIKAKKQTLPALFKKVEDEHKAMAIWMKASLIPMKAEADILKKSTESIEDRIFTVELYAGLCEDVERIRDGEPAPNDAKVHLFQRRHYMDEECLFDYKAGGMEFDDIRQFDRWLMKKKNRERILPLPRCVVAFQVRRRDKVRRAGSISNFISFAQMREADKLTFLYIRNGDIYYRMATEIEFGSKLFPDEERSLLMGGKLYTKGGARDAEVITEVEYNDLVAKTKALKEKTKRELAEWEEAEKTKPEEERGHFRPYYYDQYHVDRYDVVSPDTVYYDDAMAELGKQMRHHNRISVVLQGLLDRSPVFHPHPPWKLWTMEGFTTGIELVYDFDRVMTSGDPPDFRAYQEKLNASIKIGSHTVGQQFMWERAEAEKENERQRNDWRIRNPFEHYLYSPYGNDGPGDVAEVVRISRDKKKASFTWERERQRAGGYVPCPDKPGYEQRDWSKLKTHFKCSVSSLLHVEAYTPGDYKIFYADPRTRADYLKWAPLLLMAENYYAKKKKK